MKLAHYSSFLLLLALPLAALGQSGAHYTTPYTIATLAGQPSLPPTGGGTNNGTGSAAQFAGPIGTAVDSSGNIYVADKSSALIRLVTPAGVVTTLAGHPTFNSGYNDGTGTNAAFYRPFGVAVDSATNLYVADSGNNLIRQVTPNGTNWVVTTLAGMWSLFGGYSDGTGTNAQFTRPMGVAVDSATNLYVTDSINNTIRKVTLIGTNWVVTTLVGQPGTTGTNDGTNSAARFHYPEGVAVDSATNLYVADAENNAIRKVSPEGTNWVVTTLAGSGTAGLLDGTNTSTKFNLPYYVAVDSATNLYVADNGNTVIRKLTPVGMNWVVTTLAGIDSGGPNGAGTDDGTGKTAQFESPMGVAVDTAGNLYVTDAEADTVRRGFLAGGAPVILTNGAGLAFSNGLFGFNLAAAATQAVVVDASTDLVTWSSIWTNTVGTGVLPFSDPQSGSYSNCFYRAHLP